MPPAASAVTTLAATLAARASATSTSGAGVLFVAGLLGTVTTSVWVPPELFATTDPAASPRSDLGLI